MDGGHHVTDESCEVKEESSKIHFKHGPLTLKCLQPTVNALSSADFSVYINTNMWLFWAPVSSSLPLHAQMIL
jgi:hypothetical protein